MKTFKRFLKEDSDWDAVWDKMEREAHPKRSKPHKSIKLVLKIDIHKAQYHTHDPESEHSLAVLEQPTNVWGVEWDEARQLAVDNGFELHPNLQLGSVNKEWPLVATIWTADVEGGRRGDSFYEVPAKKLV